MEILQGNIVICFTTCHYIYFHGGTTTATTVHVVPGVNAPKILVIRQVVVVPTAVLKRVWLEVASVQGVIKVRVPCHQILCMKIFFFSIYLLDFQEIDILISLITEFDGVSHVPILWGNIFHYLIFFPRYSVILASVSYNIIMFQNLK